MSKVKLSIFTYIVLQIINMMSVGFFLVLSILFLGQESQASNQAWKYLGISKERVPILTLFSVAMMAVFIYCFVLLRKLKKIK